MSSDSDELRAIAGALRRFVQQCDELLHLIDAGRPLSPESRKRATLMYNALRAEMQAAGTTGSRTGNFTTLTAAEEAWFSGATRAAHLALGAGARQMSEPTSWTPFVMDARVELAKTLHNLDDVLRRARG